MNEQELLVDCLRRLDRGGFTYMLTGSMASNAWGMPRLTHDLDFVIQLPPSEVPRFAELFRGDYYIDEEAIRAAYRPPHQFNAIDTRSSLKVDFWLLRPVPFEREMFERRTKTRVCGEQAWLATPEDVILHKLYWDRITPSERQRSDAAGVIAVQADRLDRAYLRHWASELGVSSVLEDLLSGRIRPKTT